MSLNIERSNEEVCEKFRTRVLDLDKNGVHLELYKAYPYFIDVLEWLEGIRPFSAIRHNHDADVFTDAVLPKLMTLLKRERLVRTTFGQPKPVWDAVLLRNVPRDRETCFEVVSEQVDTLLMRSIHAKHPLRFDVVRTLASPEQIKEWRRRLVMIFEEIEDHEDPEGSPFTLNLLTLQDA
jgi:hypothetical protein